MKILIDNGHGNNTPGRCSPDGRLGEYSYTREIIGRVVFELRKLGIDAKLVMREEIDVPLSERCRRANEYKTSEAILISAHYNATSNGSSWVQARDWEAWASVGQTRTDKLADCLYTTAEECLFRMGIRKDMADGDPGKGSSFYILKHTRCPAVLTESLLQDNKEDVDFLLSEERKRTIVSLHVKGVYKYLDI